MTIDERDDPCASCGHARKWHDPCSRCACPGFDADWEPDAEPEPAGQGPEASS